MDHQAIMEAAFNQGADARLAGRPLDSNPFPPGSNAKRLWAAGWKDANDHWGQRARKYRSIPALKPLAGAA